MNTHRNTMVVFKVLLFYTFMLTLIGESYSEGCVNDLLSKSAAVRLSKDLFCSYDKNVRPVLNESKQTVVQIKFDIRNINMDVNWDILQIKTLLEMAWTDEFLTWDSSNYDNVKIIHQYSNNLWMPDIMSYEQGFNGENTLYSYLLPTSVVKIYNTGLINFLHPVTLTAQCSADIAKWPFDSHNCTLMIGSPIYFNTEVNYTFPDGYFSLEYLYPNKEWEVLDVKAECKKKMVDPNSTIEHCHLFYYFEIQRYSSMYYSSIIIPAIVISLMRTFTFLMGREISIRLTLLCLFFISELLYLQYLDATIPYNGKSLVYIVALYRNSLMLTAMALVVSIISNELYKQGLEDFPRESPIWLNSVSKFLLSIRSITILTNFNNKGGELLIDNHCQEENPNGQRNKNALFWKTLSVLLDRVLFLTTFLISVLNFWFLIP